MGRMSLQQTIKEHIKEAMRAKDQVRLTVLKGLNAAIGNELIAKNIKPDQELGDSDVLALIKRAVKQRKDSIEQFVAGGRPILETYLPQTMSQDEIRTIAEAKKAEMGITDKSKAGILMGALMKDLKDKADGSDVKTVVDSLF
jgi:uncharacterized protein